jgi:hypothetical protein
MIPSFDQSKQTFDEYLVDPSNHCELKVLDVLYEINTSQFFNHCISKLKNRISFKIKWGLNKTENWSLSNKNSMNDSIEEFNTGSTNSIPQLADLINVVLKSTVSVIEPTKNKQDDSKFNDEIRARQLTEINSLDIIESFYNETNNWQIRVRIRKIRYLLGLTENTLCYCKITVGNEEFKTNVKPINNMNYNEVSK